MAFWASSFWQHVPPSRQLGAGGGGGASTRLEGRRLRSHVGAAWGGRASLELGAWQGSPAKLPLTSGDGEQHSFIATAPSLTAVWPHPCRLDPENPALCCLWIQPEQRCCRGCSLPIAVSTAKPTSTTCSWWWVQRGGLGSTVPSVFLLADCV